MSGSGDLRAATGVDPLASLAALAERRRGGLRRGAHRAEALSDELGRAHRQVPAIHVAGTDGKTSVVRMAAALLRELGVRAGDTTSPHLHHLAERIRIDTEPVSASALAAPVAELPPALAGAEARVGEPPTFFDIITALALRVFADTDRELAVVEAGIGGRGDATAIVDARVAVLTPIGLDHVELGTTYGEVAAEKAGIVRPGGTLIAADQHPDAAEVLSDVAVGQDARLLIAGRDLGWGRRRLGPDGQRLVLAGLGGHRFEVALAVHGAVQADNAALALAAVQEATGVADLDPRAVAAAFAQVELPGRAEVLLATDDGSGAAGTTIVVDGAHDAPSSQALAATLDERFPGRPIALVIGTSGGRDPLALLGPLDARLGRRVRQVVTTSSRTRGSTPAAVVAARLRSGVRLVTEAATVARAIERAATDIGAGGVVVVTGSLYLAAEARDEVASWSSTRPPRHAPPAPSPLPGTTPADGTVRV